MAPCSYQTAPRAAAPWPACSFFYFFLGPARGCALPLCANARRLLDKNIKVEIFVFMIQLVAEASRIHILQRPRPLEARDFVVIVARKLSAMSPRFAQSLATRVADALFAWYHRRSKPRISAQGRATWGSTPVKVERQIARSSWPPGPRRCEIAC